MHAAIAAGLGAVVGVSVGALLWLGPSRSGEPAVPPTCDHGDVVAELQDIGRLLAAPRSLPRADNPDEPRPLRDEADELGPLMARLTDQIGLLTEAMAALPPAAPGRVEDPQPAVAEAARQRLLQSDAGQRGWGTADDDYFGMSPMQVRRRLGVPSSVSVDDKGMVRWTWSQDGRGYLSVLFIDGYLAIVTD